MLRKENDEIQQLKGQIKELSKDVENLKLQLKMLTAKSLISEYPVENSENTLAKSIGKFAGNAALGNDIKSYTYNKNLLNHFINVVSNTLTNSGKTSSFSSTPRQRSYQQAQNLRNLF